MLTFSKEHAEYDKDVTPSAPCRVIVFYDDVHSRDRVLKLSDYLVPQFWEDFEFEISRWRVNFITNPQFQESIIKELLGADIVIFALSPDFEISPAIRESLEFLLGFRTNSQGLLVMALTQNHDRQNQYQHIHDYLSELADRNHMDYLSEWAAKMESGQRDCSSKRIGSLDFPLCVEGDHWGINE